MFHTAYNSYESKLNGRDYIGKHSTENLDDGYLGSFTDQGFDPDSKITMAYSKTAEGAVWFEMNFQNVFDVVRDPQYANRAKQTGTKFDTTGIFVSEETRRKIGEASKGRTHNDQTRKQIAKKVSAKFLGEGNPFFGRNHTEESRQKISEATSGEKHPMFGVRGENHTHFGKRWWINDSGETLLQVECPGEGWRLGRK
jgi:hypothetical protein